MKRSNYIAITKVVATIYCEQQAVYDHMVGRVRSEAIEKRAIDGRIEHAKFEANGRALMAGDRRCFIATALYGANAHQTLWLRQWRDRVLLPRPAGRAFIRLYYALSPRLIAPLQRFSAARTIVRRTLDALIRALGGPVQ